MKKDYKETITNNIISLLEKGKIPWISPFEQQIIPMNYLTEKTYNGINLLVLWIAGMLLGYTGNYWIGFKQVMKLGGKVRRGEKGTPITVCCTYKTKDDDTEEEITGYYYKTDYVYNIFSQVEGINFEEQKPEYKPLKDFDKLIKNTGIKVRHQGEKAFYSVNDDFINMPFKHKFKNQTAYYQTLAHELIHSTLHKERCNRIQNINLRTEEGRALEELTAEIGAAYLLSEFGLRSNINNVAAYVQSWIKALKNDTNYIFKASSLASNAVKFLVA